MTSPEDLIEIGEAARDDLEQLRGTRLFVTGGTGFVGTWLLHTVAWANTSLNLGVHVDVLTRDPKAAATRLPIVAAHEKITFHRGDVLVPFPALPRADAAIHAATAASAALNRDSPHTMIDTVVEGMRHFLERAEEWGRIRVLFTSSGAVYGRQPLDLDNVSEEYGGAPDPLAPENAYHEAKRMAELLAAVATAAGALDVVIGRLFAFLGPHLPLDAHFAAGNFVRDALASGPIVIGGDGTPRRSYQYPADLVVWLLALLVRGEAGRAYNVGADDAVSIRELADRIAAAAPGVVVEQRGTADPRRIPERYVPSIARAQKELGLSNRVGLDEGIRRTLAHHIAR
ncbi:MAG: NAD-dependent epimerase/dehydratase family protein [Actinomycetota bacterium]